ncbi:MAG: hypothetical protein ACREVY_04060 [Gammaproteobacteria bacterium]
MAHPTIGWNRIFIARVSSTAPFMLVIDLILFGPLGLSIWAIQMAWIPFFAAGVVSSKWWELDLGWLHIRALCALGLARG